MLGIKTALQLKIQNRKLKKKYPEMSVILNSLTKLENISIGKGSYGEINVLSYSSFDCKLKIGNYCSIAKNTTFLLGGEHKYDTFSTFPFKKIYMDIDEAFSKGDIIINDDVWIGYGATILSGVNIGQGAVIGAGSVVTKDVPPYAIYVGNKVVKYRFDNKKINKLLKFDFSTLDRKKIIDNIDLLYKKIDDIDSDILIEEVTKNVR